MLTQFNQSTLINTSTGQTFHFFSGDKPGTHQASDRVMTSSVQTPSEGVCTTQTSFGIDDGEDIERATAYARVLWDELLKQCQVIDSTINKPWER